MKIYPLHIFTFISLLTQIISAQEKNINGRIIIDLDDSSPDGVYITNSRTQLTAITDLTGSFTLNAQADESLLFQSIFNESRRFYHTENLMNYEFINIHFN